MVTSIYSGHQVYYDLITHSSKDADDKHVDEEGDEESNGRLNGVVLNALLHLHRVAPRDSSTLKS